MNVLGILVKNQLTIFAWVYFWTVQSVLLICSSVCMPVEYYFDFCFSVIHLLFEIMKYDDSSFVIKLFLKVGLTIFGSFVVLYKSQNNCFYSSEKFLWNFVCYIQYVGCFGQYGHFKRTNSSIHQQVLLCLLHFLSSVSISFECISLLPLQLNFYFILDALYMILFS